MSKEKKIIYISLDKNNNIANIKELFEELFECKSDEKENTLLFVLTNEKVYEDYELFNMIDTIKEDFNENLNIFESNILNDNMDYDNLIDIYKQNCKVGYTNISTLVSNIVEKGNNLKNLKEYVLYSFEKDNDLLFVCKAMFKNNLNVSKAAEDAYMHRNTVINKIDTICKKTGLNIQKFNDAMAMYMLINTK